MIDRVASVYMVSNSRPTPRSNSSV